MITVLQAKKGNNLTKSFTASGTVSYSRAKYFTHYQEPVTDIYSLSAVLTSLADKKDCCVIRGQFNPDHNAPELFDGKFLPRKAQLFTDKPLNWVMLDVDGFKTNLPALEAILYFIDTQLPKVFRERSFHWQLSSSYNTKGKEGLLKAHLWFWLDTPYDSPTLKKWALTVPVDASVFNTVSVHYTASPIFVDIPDPVTTRCGLYEGMLDSVPLTLTPVPPVEREYTVEKVSDPEWPLSRIISEVLPNISPDLSNDEWVKVGMALHHQGGGGSEWLQAFDNWSEPGQSYTTEVCESRWESFERSQGSTVSIGTLLHMANISRSTVATDDEFDNLTNDLTHELVNPSRFPVVHISDFKARQTQGYHIKHILPVADMVMVYGASGAGKSFVVFDMAMAIARGVPWRDHRVTKGTVAYLIAEGAGGFNGRIKAYTDYHGVDVAELPFYVIPANPNFLQASDIKDLIAGVIAFNPDIIIVDTWAQVTAGGNENSGEDMGKALANCRKLKDKTGATVLLIHHSGKDADRGARGWSGLKGAADAEMEVARSNDDRVLSVTKLKDGIEGLEFGFKLNVVTLGLDSDGDELTSCVVLASDTSRVQVNMGKYERVVYEAVRDAMSLDGIAPDVNTVLDTAVAQIPYDSTVDKRDRRRDLVLKAYKKGIERGFFIEKEGRVECV